MRIAFATNPALGHLLPLLPMALAARDAGHDVVILAGTSLTDAIARSGLRHVVAGPDDLPTAFAHVPERAGLTGRRLAAVIWSRAFGGIIAPEMADALLTLAAGWRPDLLVHEDSEQGTWIAAERLGIPHVALQATAWRGTGLRLSDEPLNGLRASLGLAPDPGLARWHRHGYLATRPAALLNPDDPLPAAAIPLRPVALDELDGEVPAWLAHHPGGPPRVAVTLGTMLPGRIDAMTAIIDGLEPIDVEVVATVGPGLDPGDLGARRSTVHVERYVPMSRLLATCDALVFHGGSGTMLAALAVGVPLVLLPTAADQPENADRCVAAGVGVALGPDTRTALDVERAVRTVLDDPGYAAAAGDVGAAIAAMPAPESVLARLEALATAGPDGTLATG
ncbi:MAG: glycosyltransferase [Candidatus Limnocylindrales bacterium]